MISPNYSTNVTDLKPAYKKCKLSYSCYTAPNYIRHTKSSCIDKKQFSIDTQPRKALPSTYTQGKTFFFEKLKDDLHTTKSVTKYFVSDCLSGKDLKLFSSNYTFRG